MADAKLRLSVGDFTSQGTRPYNEDGYVIVKDFNSLIDNIALHNVPRSLFAVYDGHGGDACMKFVRNVLHVYVAQALCETKGDTKLALKKAFAKAEDEWMSKVLDDIRQGRNPDTSGSTATVCLFEGTEIFCAFVGDSPAWLINSDLSTSDLSRDHKPDVKSESKRIKSKGGVIKRSTKNGPFRVYPGGIAVARSFGDPTSKLKELGGIPGTLIAEPEITHHTLKALKCQFLVICSDGVTDNMKSRMDIYMPLIQGFLPGLEIARKSQKLSPEVDLDVCAKYIATNAVNSVIKTDGSYQDNATALVIMFGDELVKKENDLREAFRKHEITYSLQEVM